jgi:TonB family protein
MIYLKSFIRKLPIIVSFFLLISGDCFTQEFHGQNLLPVYPGGPIALREFINKNLHYPDNAVKNKISGAVMLEFVVAGDGNIKDINIISGLDDECDQEAVRVVGLLKGWEPAINWGNPVDSKMRIPIAFRPEGNMDIDTKNYISGVIMEKCSGRLLGGVLVRIMDTNIGTLTGNDGRFGLEIPSGNNELEFSSIGYEIRTINVKNYRTLNVELDRKVYEIDLDNSENR